MGRIFRDTVTAADIKEWFDKRAVIAGRSVGNGLTFTLSKAGCASWVLRYRHGGRQREITLGNYPDMTLDAANRMARKKRVEVDSGVDVASLKRREEAKTRTAGTFSQLAADYLAKRGSALAIRSQNELRRYLKKDLIPRLGARNAREITSHDVIDVIESIGRRSDPVARRSFEILSRIFAHAIGRKAVDTNPCAGIEVSSVLGVRQKRRERLMLSSAELNDLLKALPATGEVNALAFKILLATCVRKGELIKAEWEHVNLEAGTWHIPDEHSKTRRGFVVPLAKVVISWFARLKELSMGSKYVLPTFVRRGLDPDRHMSDKTLNEALYRCGEIRVRNFTPHDLRSTARSHLAELGVSLVVAERCLNHTLGGLVAIYDRHDYFEERRRALELWANLLVELETGRPQNVIQFPAAA